MSETRIPPPATSTTVAPDPVPRRRWRHRLLVAGVWVLTAVLGLGLVAGAAGVWTVHRSFPDYDGTHTLRGLSARVTVYRDDHGIPQVYASNPDDLFRAQGYVHAQERFWEMDFRRHVTGGQLSELFGPGQLPTDRYLRTMGWRHVAEQEWGIISPQAREWLQAYADGVNAWLRERTGQNPDAGPVRPSSALSLEYGVLALQNSGYRVRKWDPVDSLAWLKAMAWDLRGNMSDEIDRATLLAHGLTRQQVDQLWPAYPFDRNPPIVTGGTVTGGAFQATPATPAALPQPSPGAGDDVVVAALRTSAPALQRVRADLAALPRMVGINGDGIGSNSWVISGKLTASGKPLLANDPHLAPSMPGIWYQMGLHCTCAFNVAGFTFSGVPGVIIGHNDRVAWGFTNLNPDVTDLYLERVDGDRYQVGDEWRPLTTRQETLKVAGGADETLTVRSTPHGPLLSDVSDELRDLGASGATVAQTGGAAAAGAGRYAVALRWTALDPGRTIDALFAMDQARDWATFRAAAALFEVPAQNLVYADVDGTIGYQSPGKVPVRGKGDGKLPAPGWDPAYDWTGYLPFDQLPSVTNPASGYIVTANQAVIGPQYPNHLTDDWAYGYRSQRIGELIKQAGGGITVDAVGRTQFDNRNNMAPTLVPALLAAPADGRVAKARELLRGWDFQQPRSSAAAAFYNATWRHLMLRTFDELPDGSEPDGNDRWFEVVRSLLPQTDSPWWDEKSTPAVEHRDDMLSAAMADATDELTKRYGADPKGWRWGDLHQLTMRNATFGKSGIAPIEWLFNYGPFGVAGGASVVNATSWNAASGGYDVTNLPSMRMIVDLSDLDASRWIQLTGNSAHAFSPHYHDQFELWRTGRTLPMRWDEARIRRESTATLTLRPA